MLTPSERSELIQKIAKLPAQLEQLVCELTPAQLSARPLVGEWSVAQNVHHLADSHMNSFVRMKLAITEENPTFKPYDQDAWAETPDANHADISESLRLLRGLHRRWVRLFESVAGEQWLRAGVHPEYGRRYTIEDILCIYAEHGEAHLDQIARTLAAQAPLTL